MIMNETQIGEPPSSPRRVQRQRLLQALNAATLYDTAAGRDTLLIDLWDTVAPTVARAAGKWADLAAIVEATERWGHLPDGTPALQVLIDNAINALAGSDSARALAALRSNVTAPEAPTWVPVLPWVEATSRRPLLWKVGASLLALVTLGGLLLLALNPGPAAQATPAPSPIRSTPLTQPSAEANGGGQPAPSAQPARAIAVFTSVKTLPVQSGTVYGLAFSPDGRRLATAGTGGMIGLWDVESGQAIFTQLGHSGDANSVAFHPKGNLLATGGDDGIVHVWDVTNATSVFTLTIGPVLITYVAFSPTEDDQLITAAGDGKARLWDIVTSGLVLPLNGDTQGLYSADFSPDGHQVVTAGQDGKAQIWDARTGVNLWTATSTGGGIKRALFSPDSRWLVTAGDDMRGQLWNTATRTRGPTLVGHSNGITSAAFSRDSRLVVTGSKDGTVRVWEVVSGTLLQTLSAQNSEVWSTAFSPDRHTLAVGSADGLVRFWTMR